MEPEDLADMIKTDTPTDTRIMSISVENENPKEAKQIADALRKAVLSSYDKIKRLKIEPRKKEQKLYRSLLYKGFSRDEILDVIKEEDLYFD